MWFNALFLRFLSAFHAYVRCVPSTTGEVLSASIREWHEETGPVLGPRSRRSLVQRGVKKEALPSDWVQLCFHCQAWDGRQGLYASFLYVQNKINNSVHPQVVLPSPGHGPTHRPSWEDTTGAQGVWTLLRTQQWPHFRCVLYTVLEKVFNHHLVTCPAWVKCHIH